MKSLPVETSDIRQLKKLLDEITSGVKNTVAKCIAAGKLLTEIKGKTKYGDWNTVLKSVDLAYHTAEQYMLLWEHRTKYDFSQIRTIKEASELIFGTQEKVGTNSVRIARLATPTTQNEALTYEKDSTSIGPIRSLSGPIRRSHSTEESTSNNQKGTLKGGFQSDEVPRDNSRAYLSGPSKTHAEIRLDKVGRPIPDGILELWNRAYEVGTRLRSIVSDVKCELEKGLDKDLIFAELINSIVSDAKSLHYSLSQILPYAVCPSCNGKLPSKCLTCRTRGFVSQHYYEGPAVGRDMRALIEKQSKASYASQTISA